MPGMMDDRTPNPFRLALLTNSEDAAGKLWLKMFSTKIMHERNGRIDKGRFDPLPFLTFHFSITSTMKGCLLTLAGLGKVFFAGKGGVREWRWGGIFLN
jgi:hypothetical protein